MGRILCFLLLLATFVQHSLAAEVSSRPNLLLITVDDISTASVGVFGSSTPDTTPHIDQLANAGIRFERAHVQVANCTPSRNVMWSGRYPHTNKVEGFRQVKKPGYEILPDLVRKAGYFAAIHHKVNSSTPYYPYNWDMVLDKNADGTLLNKKDPESYGLSTRRGIEAATRAGKPFALMINISDAHVPLYGLDKFGEEVKDPFKPSRIYKPDEVAVPGFLVDDPIVRRELSHYYSSVRRADDAVGYILRALQESGKADNTLVMFISDHGMPFPFAKTQLYHHSTSTPLIFRWPAAIKENSVDNQHLVSAVDILPTLLESIGSPLPAGLQGQSFLPLLKGEPQEGYDMVFKEYNENASEDRAPMRAVQDSRFLYLFNPWSNGTYRMSSATLFTATFERMEELAESDKKIAQRVRLLKHRVPEEFYDIQNDPDCLNNLIAAPRYSKELVRLQSALERHMRETQDPLLDVFVNRDDKEFVATYMRNEHLEARKRKEFKRAFREAMQKKAAETENSPVSDTQ